MKRINYLRTLRQLIPKYGCKNIVYMDESGFKRDSYRTHGWAPRGQKIYADISGNNRKDINLIMAQRGSEWLAPVLFKGSCCAKLVNEWFKNFLLKELYRPSIIIMDNAAFHKKSEIKAIVEKAGHVLLPLPPYSPDFNPIEQSFALLKKRRQFSNKSLEQFLMSQSYLE